VLRFGRLGNAEDSGRSARPGCTTNALKVITLTPERWHQVKQLFHQALELDEKSRAAFLGEACSGDENLRREVESLVSGHNQAGSFIETPPGPSITEAISEPQVSFTEGQVIGHYRIVARLGSGGMGDVYLASDTKLNRKVAIKLVASHSVTDDLAKQRLIREAQAAAKLDHPNVCTIHEVGEENGQAFIVMQHIEGDTLAHRIRQQPLEIHEAVDIALQVTDALTEAHSHGIIHRDLKPQNIMITRRGQAKVLDFGLAKVFQDSSSVDSDAETERVLSQPGIIIGTVPYLSPEQLLDKNLDVRSDIFSLGSMIYEMVTGRQAFAADSRAATIAAILNTEPKPVAWYTAGVPDEFERILRRCLEKDRDRRYQSAGELHLDLIKLRSSLVSIKGSKTHRMKLHWKPILALLAVAVLGPVAVVLYQHANRNPVERRIDSLAVLPFSNEGVDPANEYLMDGVTDSLVNRLSQLGELKVIALNSMVRYRTRDPQEGFPDAKVVGHDLNVKAVLIGRIVQVGNSISIRAELTDARDDSQVWGNQYKRSLSDILTVAEDIARDLTARLLPGLKPEESKKLSKRYTESREATELYQKGRFYWNKRTPEGMMKAIDNFQEAILKDSKYALPYAGLADCYVLGLGSTSPPKEAMPRARKAAEIALGIDESLCEAHTSLAQVKFWYDWDWPGAEREFKRAIELNQNYATAHQWYAEYLAALGRLDEAMTQMRQAQEIDPLSLIISSGVGKIFYYGHQYRQAIDQYLKTLEMDKDFPQAHFNLGIAYEKTGMFSQAVTEILTSEAASSLSGEDAKALETAYKRDGWKGFWRKELDLARQQSKHTYVPAYNIARAYARLGETDQVFEWLQRAYENQDHGLAAINIDPTFEEFHSNSGFSALLDKIGLPH